MDYYSPMNAGAMRQVRCRRCYGGFDDRDLVAQIDGLRLRGGCPRPARSSAARQQRNIARIAAGGVVNRTRRSAGSQLRIRAKAGAGADIVASPGSTASGRSTRSADVGFTSPSGVALEPAPIHFAHARIHADQDPRRPARATCWATAARSEMPTVGKLRAEGQSLHDADRNSHAGERARTAAVGHAIEMSQRQPALARAPLRPSATRGPRVRAASPSRARRCARR